MNVELSGEDLHFAERVVFDLIVVNAFNETISSSLVSLTSDLSLSLVVSVSSSVVPIVVFPLEFSEYWELMCLGLSSHISLAFIRVLYENISSFEVFLCVMSEKYLL